MSFAKQLNQQRSAVSAAYSADYIRKKSLVYDNSATVNQDRCYSECLKAFIKLRNVDSEMKEFENSLFAPSSLSIIMCRILPAHKRSIDMLLRKFLLMIDHHIKSSEAPWALEWLVYKFEVQRHYTDDFMRLMIPHYESGLFIKAIQILDYKNISSDWLWLKPYAQRGTPLSRQEFYRACCNQTTLIPFIAETMNIYAKFESDLGLNRIANVCNFFTYTLVGIFELELPVDKRIKIVNALQGILRNGLRSNILAFKSSAICVVLRIACSMTLNHELVLDWIGCLLKTAINGSQWNVIKSIRHLMKSQGVLILPDELRTVYENLLNELSPLERATIEQEEEKQLIDGDVSALASTSLQQLERVQKATIMMDFELTEKDTTNEQQQEEEVAVTKEKKKHKKLTVKRVLKMSTEQLFSRDPLMQEQFEFVHRILGTHGACVTQKSECECVSRQSECEHPENWLTDFLISTLVLFTQTESLEQEVHAEGAHAMLINQQCKSALRIIKVAFDCSKDGGSNTSLMKALNKAFPCVLSALLHPVGEVRVVAYETLGLYLNEFKKISDTAQFNYVYAFLADVREKAEIMSDSTKSLLQGDSLSALVRTTTDLVQAVFRLFCRQPLKDDAFSQMCWFSAAQLLQNDLLKFIIQLGAPSSLNGSGSKCGWNALLQLLKAPPVKRFEVVHLLCLSKLDAFTLPTLASLCTATSNRQTSIDETSLYENELLNALIDTECHNRSPNTRLSSVLPRLLLKVEHYTYLLEKLDPSHNRPAKSLSARLANRNRNSDNSTNARRLSILQVVLSALVADMYRLQTSSTAEKHDALQRSGSSSSLLSLIGSSIKRGSKRRPSKVGRGSLTAFGDTVSKDNDEGSSRKDIVHPLNNHLLACIQVLQNGSKNRRWMVDESMSTDSDSDEGVVEDDHSSDRVVADSVNLQEQTLACMQEVLIALTKLFEVGNTVKATDKSKSCRKSPLMPTFSVKSVMGNIFGFLNVFESSINIQRQAVLCLVEMASLFPLTLCEQLLTLIKWIGGIDHGHSIFLQIDNVHNLHLMDRLICTAIPALLKVSSSRVEAGLKVLDVFVRGLPDLPTDYPRRCLTLYAGLVRGLADVTAPAPLTEAGISKRDSKQFALSGWLSTAAITFFNTNYPSEEIAGFVFSLLTDLFNQFELVYQLGAWQQCFKFCLYLISNPPTLNLQKAQENNSKRSRLDISGEDSCDCDYSFLLKHLSKADDGNIVDPVVMDGRKRSRPSDDWVPRSGDEIRLWPLLANISAFFTNLLQTPGHHIRQQKAVKDSLQNTQESLEDIVQLIVQLLISSTTSTIEVTDSENDGITRKDAITNLKLLLVEMNGLMSSQTFLRAVSRLMSFKQTNLTRKALDLLLAKLESLTVKCPNAAQLLSKQGTEPLPQMEKTLREGLVEILDKLSSSVIASNNILSSDRNATLHLSCLQKLAQLLCETYSEKMVKILDHLLSINISNWWPSDNDGVSKTVKMATEAADIRSMVCLFAFECLAHLSPALVSIRGAESSMSTRLRIRRALRFALDHASTACGLADRPMGSTTAVAGTFRSREQHLQAAVTLMLGVFEFSTKINDNDQSELVLQVLNEEISSTKLNGHGDRSEALVASLFTFVFRTTNINLAVATKTKAERSSVPLKQSVAIINRLRNKLVALPESTYSLRLSYDLIKDAKPETDSDLLSGSLEFISRHADRMFSLSTRYDVDLDASRSGEGLENVLDITYSSDPLLIWNILSLSLECHPVSTTQNDDSNADIAKAAGMACASILAALNHDNRLQLIRQCLQWLVLDSPNVSVVMTRLESFFAVLHRLASKLAVQSFLNLVKETFLPHLFVCTLSLLSGEHKSKNVKKIANQLELPYLVSCFSSGISRATSLVAGSCAKATYAAITAWLQAEAASSTCLDTAGTEAVLALPQIIPQPLLVANLGLTEIDLVPCVDAFLRAIGGDEALVRPFGSSLCALLRNSHWKTRLAGVHLLRQTFEILTEGDSGDLGLIACLQPDMYTALSEAMEDKRSEVEAAANRLFAELEALGATMENKE